MSDSLSGKTALVTAAGRGIGRAIADALVHAGATVIATARDVVALQGLRCRIEPLDVCDRDAIHTMVASVLRVDALVNCAGYVHQGTLLDVDAESWSRSFDLNVRSMFWTMQAAVPRMIQCGGKSIINIASVVSSIKAAPQRFVYAATKAAVIGMTKAVAADFITQGIRANAICPGTIDTPSLRERISGSVDAKNAREKFLARQPTGRLGRAEEIAQLAVYLASEAGAFSTGATFVIDGGMSL
jgi:2-keto-3-deoxy-L-fuconate dehydrogenase